MLVKEINVMIQTYLGSRAYYNPERQPKSSESQILLILLAKGIQIRRQKMFILNLREIQPLAKESLAYNLITEKILKGLHLAKSSLALQMRRRGREILH